MQLEMKAYKRAATKLGERLVSEGLITEDQLEAALDRQRIQGNFLGQVIVSLGYLAPSEIGPHLEEATGFPFIDIVDTEIDVSVAQKITESFARLKGVLPFREDDEHIYVAMADPLNVSLVDELRGRLKKPIIPCLAILSDIDEIIRRTFNVKLKTSSLLEEISTDDGPKTDFSIDTLLGLAQDAPIVRLVNNIIQGALSNEASDIHIEPQEDTVRVRYRVDGLLYEQMEVPPKHVAAIVSRLKIMSSLDIAERRRAQDGRFSVEDEQGKAYDVRLSIMPTVYGEKAVMRLLEKSSSLSSLEMLGFFPDQLKAFRKFIHKPHGIILVTGPTGSGKSTTLYAGLHEINSSSLNINTIEDPVEYRLQGVNQVQVNPRIGVTFATGLRTLVRQDPDVILVGEIRDAETAEIAVQAALTGHLVLSTLHTNNAPGALVRLQHMGIEPFLISSAVTGVIGQRLLRTLCPSCKKTFTPNDEFAEAYGIQKNDGKYPELARSKGCKRCNGRGTKGRTAVYEVMQMSDVIREKVLNRASGAELMDTAMREGMVTMHGSGMKRVLDHTVAPEEAFRVLSVEEE